MTRFLTFGDGGEADGFVEVTGPIAGSVAAGARQALVAAGYAGGVNAALIDNDAAKGKWLGYAQRAYAIGETWDFTWGVSVPGVDFLWSEWALCTGDYRAGFLPELTVVGFVSAVMTGAGAFNGGINLAAPIAAGAGLYAVAAAAQTTTPPELYGTPAESLLSMLSLICTVPGWRPSLQLGVPTPFLGTLTTAPASVWSGPVLP